MIDSAGVQDGKGPWQLITANSSCAVTLIANNLNNANLQYDSYLVLPTKWAKDGYVYAFTLPPGSDNYPNEHITIIPTERDVKGVLNYENDLHNVSQAFTAKLVGPTAYFMNRGWDTTYKIEADGPILVSFSLETRRKQK
ncbi:unnamed protein product [Cylicostephanus goldi]|uniref:IgGFc-binding protein N-terminal domain-containing protein n=1 Tax=Cylicostephanus goldi TaxID=71465 RepID=A0A3P7P4R3_CYLGO|nr:unnamed protein product [Cylicostephanus goldi]